MFNARANNAGWRIDYFVVSDRLKEAIHDATIHPEYLGSDHCPVGLDLNITCNGGVWSPETRRSNEPEHSKADGTSPVGSIFKGAVASILLLAIIITVHLIPRSAQQPAPTKTKDIAAVLPTYTGEYPVLNLISNVIDRSGTIETIILDSYDSTSSTIQEAFTDGALKWRLASPTVSPFVPNNFHIQLVFSSRSKYNDLTKPEISYRFEGVMDNDYITHVYYYDYDGTIAGCFLYGRTERARQVHVTVTDNHLLSSSQKDPDIQELTVSIAGDLSATDDL